MMLSEAEIKELQRKYSHLHNFESQNPLDPINPLTYVDSNSDTLLHVAAQLGDLRTVELLLKAGLDPNLVGDMGSTALHYAKTDEVAQALISYGASTEIVNEFGKRPRVPK